MQVTGSPASVRPRDQLSARSPAKQALEPGRRTLPASTYCSAEFYAKELERIHLGAWHWIGHVSELKEPGSYVAAEFLGRRVFAMRGEDGEVRAFHNVCPHRAHAVVTGTSGRCESVIRCPYHAWTFELDGQLKAPAFPKTLPKLDAAEFGLKPVEAELFMGLIFVRFRAGASSLAEQLQPHLPLLASYRISDMQPCRPHWANVVEADWKNVMDNYLECYHCPIGHPGLSCLMQAEYENLPDDTTRTALFYHDMRETPPWGWSQKAYNSILPELAHLPKAQQRRWNYLFAYPGLTLNLYPEQMSVMVIRPLGPGRAWVGGRNYGLPLELRGLEAARFLNMRINSEVQREDVSLVTSVQRGLESGAYHTGVFSDREVGVAAFHRWVREDMPEAA